MDAFFDHRFKLLDGVKFEFERLQAQFLKATIWLQVILLEMTGLARAQSEIALL